MTFKEELTAKVQAFAQDSWGEIPDGYSVPDAKELNFGNTGRRLNACILYADICSSTEMVNELLDMQAAEYYKAYLHCAAKIIKHNGGEITAYDGDRVMAIFLGNSKEDDAVGTALQLSYAVDQIINLEFSKLYTTTHRKLMHTVGIDVSTVLASKTGVRLDNDLVWVGSAANYAAKLNSFEGLDPYYPIRVTTEVLIKLSSALLFGTGNKLMWDGPYTNLNPKFHYRTNFWLSFN